MPGPVASEMGMVVSPPIMPGWDQYPIRGTLEKEWNRPVAVHNDANFGALGEWMYGTSRHSPNLVFLKVGTGIGLGMILGISFMLIALLEGTDSRLVHYSSETDKCAALSLCKGCAKYADVPCGLRRVFLLLIPSVMVLAGIPLTALPQMVSYNTTIMGTPYNYSHAIIQQLVEIRYAPLAAILFLSLALALLALRGSRGVPPSKVLFGIGVGYLTFGLLRLVLLGLFSSNMVWFVFWEEATELLLILAILTVLVVFRDRLLAKDPGFSPRAAPTKAAA